LAEGGVLGGWCGAPGVGYVVAGAGDGAAGVGDVVALAGHGAGGVDGLVAVADRLGRAGAVAASGMAEAKESLG